MSNVKAPQVFALGPYNVLLNMRARTAHFEDRVTGEPRAPTTFELMRHAADLVHEAEGAENLRTRVVAIAAAINTINESLDVAAGSLSVIATTNEKQA